MKDFAQIINENIKQGRPISLVTVVDVKGSAPQRLGAKMLVSKQGKLLWGTIGGGRIEELALKQSRIQIEKQESSLKEYLLTENGEKATGMLCGGRMSLFFDVIGLSHKIFIFGAGHISQALVPLLQTLDFEVNVIDDREQYLVENFSQYKPVELISGKLPLIIDSIELEEGAFVVIVSYSHKIDEEILKYLLTKRKEESTKLKYLGMIGSNRKVKEIFKRLLSEGVDETLLNRVYAPIGLPIKSHSPQEIAISIAAQIIEVKNS